jgi:hypothetical protein
VSLPIEFKLKIFDRYVAFGSRALLSLALAIISLDKKELVQSPKEIMLPLLQDPMKGPRLRDWKVIMEKWDKLFLSKSDYLKAIKKAGVENIP